MSYTGIRHPKWLLDPDAHAEFALSEKAGGVRSFAQFLPARRPGSFPVN